LFSQTEISKVALPPPLVPPVPVEPPVPGSMPPTSKPHVF
jgi:hypothetical protein